MDTNAAEDAPARRLQVGQATDTDLKIAPPEFLRDLPFWALCGLAPLGVFLWFFHWQILLPDRITWLLQGDWGTNVIAWNAFRQDVWRWPLGHTTLIAWPTGATMTYTDALPLVCLLLKPIAGLLPNPFQFTGAWLLTCIVLQFVSAFVLLRPHAASRLAPLTGAVLLTLMPTLLNRFIHPTLCSHFTILLSLHAFINIESGPRRDRWYGAMLVLSALINPYLLFMNAGIWASDVLRRGFAMWRTKALAAEGPAFLIRSTVVALCPVVVIWLITGLSGYSAGSNGFGFFSMSLDALINPGLEGYSRFIHARPQSEGQIFEGFQYLGLGLIGMVAAAGVALLTQEGRAQLRRMGWLAWLTPALIVLTALALSDKIRLNGEVIAHLSYDWLPINLPAMFRASGRLFWPCAYALVVAAMQLVFALPRAFPLVVTLTALLVQASDLTAFAADIRSQTKAATQPEHYARTPSPLWEPLVASATLVEFQPPISYADIIPFYEITWRATTLRRPVNIAYTSRTNPGQEAIEKAARRRFVAGALDPTHLYVLLDGCVPAKLDRSLVRELDGLLIIPPATARSLPLAGAGPSAADSLRREPCDSGTYAPG